MSDSAQNLGMALSVQKTMDGQDFGTMFVTTPIINFIPWQERP